MRLFICSTMFRYEDWSMHYAYLYNAESFTEALEQAIQHFQDTQRGDLLSVNMTDGKDVLVMRRNLLTGEDSIEIVPVGENVIPAVGPYTGREEGNGKATSGVGDNSGAGRTGDGDLSSN